MARRCLVVIGMVVYFWKEYFVFIYKILAVLLTASPVTMSSEAFYFPYSFLGLTLFFLTSLFTRKAFFPALDCVFWFFAIVFIFTRQELAYNFLIYLFVLYQYINLYVISHQRFLAVGIAASFAAMAFPIISPVNIALLAVFMAVLKRGAKRKITAEPIERYLYDLIIPNHDDTPQIDNDEIIPHKDEQKETDYVIPSTQED